jgi:eukaryotic-like serine/threonine-protein kinase
MSNPPLVLPFRTGEVVAGKYVIDRLVGEGGMGYVVAARHVDLDEPVAIKFLRPEALSKPDIVARFAREARASTKIKSEHVPRVLDVGSLPACGPFIVMEYLDGRDLGAVLQERGSLAVSRAVECMIQACEALAAAHAAGIVHQDVKPENVFVAKRGAGLDVVKILDFGISTATLTDRPVSPTGAARPVTGSLSYMSPEQIRGEQLDHRTDIWSLGAVLYELLAGRNAFEAPSVPALSTAILESEPPSLVALRPDVPVDLAAVVMRCLTKDPEARYQNVADLALALLPFAPRRSVFSVEQCAAALRDAGWQMRSEHPIAMSRTPSLDASPEVDTLPPPPPCGVHTSTDPTVGGARFSREVLFAGRSTRFVPLAFALAAAGAAAGIGATMLFRSPQPAAGACASSTVAPQQAPAAAKKVPDAGF